MAFVTTARDVVTLHANHRQDFTSGFSVLLPEALAERNCFNNLLPGAAVAF